MGFDWEMAANVATTVSALLLFSMAVYRYKKTPPLEALMLEGADKALLQFGMFIEEYLNKLLILCTKSVLLIMLVEFSRRIEERLFWFEYYILAILCILTFFLFFCLHLVAIVSLVYNCKNFGKLAQKVYCWSIVLGCVSVVD